MDWQDYVVTAIMIAAAAAVVRWLWRLLCGRPRGGCASCASTQCPLREFKKRQ